MGYLEVQDTLQTKVKLAYAGSEGVKTAAQKPSKEEKSSSPTPTSPVNKKVLQSTQAQLGTASPSNLTTEDLHLLNGAMDNIGLKDPEMKQIVLKPIKSNLSNNSFEFKGELTVDSFYALQAYATMLETMGFAVNGKNDAELVQNFNRALIQFKKEMAGLEKLSEEETKNDAIFSPQTQLLLIREYGLTLKAIKDFVVRFAPGKSEEKIEEQILRILSGRESKVLLLELIKMNSEVSKMQVATIKDGVISKEKEAKERNPLFEIIREFVSQKYPLTGENKKDINIILNYFTQFCREQNISNKTKEALEKAILLATELKREDIDLEENIDNACVLVVAAENKGFIDAIKELKSIFESDGSKKNKVQTLGLVLELLRGKIGVVVLSDAWKFLVDANKHEYWEIIDALLRKKPDARTIDLGLSSDAGILRAYGDRLGLKGKKLEQAAILAYNLKKLGFASQAKFNRLTKLYSQLQSLKLTPKQIRGALGIAYYIVKLEFTPEQRKDIKKIYASLGDLTGNPMVINAPLIRSMIEDYTSRKMAWEPKPAKMEMMEGDREEILYPEELADKSPMCATKAVLRKKGLSPSDVHWEAYTSKDIKEIIKVFKRGGWVAQVLLAENIKDSLKKALEYEGLAKEDKDIIEKIYKMQYGSTDVELIDSEREKIINDELKKKIESLLNNEKKEERQISFLNILVALDTLKKEGNLIRSKTGLDPEEIITLENFAKVLEEGKILVPHTEDGDYYISNLLTNNDITDPSLRDLYNKAVKSLRKIGNQLSLISPPIDPNKVSDFLGTVREGLASASREQKMKLSGVEDHILIAFKAITYGKGEKDNRLQELKELLAKIKAKHDKIKEIREEYDKCIGEIDKIKAEYKDKTRRITKKDKETIERLIDENKARIRKAKVLAGEIKQPASSADKLTKILFGGVTELQFIEKNKKLLRKAAELIDPVPTLEGYPIRDLESETSKRIVFSEGYTFKNPNTGKDVTVHNAYDFVVTVLKQDGGTWQTLNITPGERNETSIAKEVLAMMIYQSGVFSKNQINTPAAIVGGIPVGGALFNILFKFGAGAFPSFSTGNYEFGVEHDQELKDYLPDGSFERFLYKARTMLSMFVEPQRNQKANMSPYLYMLLLGDTDEKIEMLTKIITQAEQGKEVDIIGNLSRIDSGTVTKAKVYFDKLETKINALFKRESELYDKFKKELLESPQANLIESILELDDETKTIRFKDLEKLNQLAQKIKDKKIALYINPKHLDSDIREEGKVLLGSLLAAFTITGIIAEYNSVFISPLFLPPSYYDLKEGWEGAVRARGGDTEILRVSDQKVGLLTQVGNAFAYAYENPGDTASGAFLESIYTSAYFAAMPVVFSYQFTQWAGDVVEWVKLHAEGRHDEAGKIGTELWKRIVQLNVAVIRFGFDPTVFLTMIKERLDAEDYPGALGVALAVGRFALHVAVRDYYLATNIFRWMAGKPTVQMGWGLFDLPVRGGVWGFKKIFGEGLIEKVFRLNPERRYEYLGRRWDESASPWFSEKWDNFKLGLRWFGENKGSQFIADQFRSSGEKTRSPIIRWPLGKLRKGIGGVWDIYWNKILGQQWPSKFWGGIANKTKALSGWPIYSYLETSNWKENIENLERSLSEAETTLSEIERKDAKAAAKAGKGQEAKIFTRNSPQARFSVDPRFGGIRKNKIKGVKLTIRSGDPRNAAYQRRIEEVLKARLTDNRGIAAIDVKIDGIESRKPIKEVVIESGRALGYRVYLYEGEPGVELHIGQELLIGKEAEKLEDSLISLEKSAAKVELTKTKLIEKTLPSPTGENILKLSQVKIGARPIEEVSARIDSLQETMKNLSYKELISLNEKLEAELEKVKGNETEMEKLVELMDKSTFDLEKTLGEKKGSMKLPTDLTIAEVRLAQAREIIRRITCSDKTIIGNGPGQIPEHLYKEAQKASKEWGMDHKEGAINLTTVQIEGILVMHKGYGAQIITGGGKTNIMAALHMLNSLSGKPIYSTTYRHTTARENFEVVKLFLQEAGVPAAVARFSGTSFSTLKNIFSSHAKGGVIYIAQSDLTFIHLINRSLPEARLKVPIDFERGVFAVDEYDFIVVDEGQTPHIISDPDSAEVPDAKAWRKAYETVKQLTIGKHYDSTKDGYRINERFLKERIFLDEKDRLRSWNELSLDQQHRIRKCLEAKHLASGIDYEVSYWQGKAIIIDKSTGQFKPGSEWSDGLHQAVQAKHGSLKITSPLQTLESITAAEFANLIKWKVGCSGSLLEIARLLERKGVKVVVVEPDVPQYEYDSSKTPKENYNAAKAKVEEVRATRGVRYGKDVQIVYSPEQMADAEAVISKLEDKGKGFNVSKRVDHNERVFKNREAELRALSRDMVSTVEAEGGAKNARPQVVVVENPKFAKAIYKEVKNALKNQGCRVWLITHNDEALYKKIITQRKLQPGDVVISTLIRRASDIKIANEKGAILYVVDRGESSWGHIQKIGRWPRFGKNGERRIFSSLEDPIYSEEITPKKAKNILINKKVESAENISDSPTYQLLERIHRLQGRLTYGDIFRVLMGGKEIAERMLNVWEYLDSKPSKEVSLKEAKDLLIRNKIETNENIEKSNVYESLKWIRKIKGRISCRDMFEVLTRGGEGSTDVYTDIVEMAQEVSNKKIFEREFRMEQLHDVKKQNLAEIDAGREKLQIEAATESLRRIITEQVRILAQKHGIKEGTPPEAWDWKGFERELGDLFNTKDPVRIRYRGSNVTELAEGTANGLFEKLFSDDALRRAGLTTHDAKKWKYIIFEHYKRAERRLERTWERSVKKFDADFAGGMFEVDGEGKLVKADEKTYSSLEELRKHYETEAHNLFEIFRRQVIRNNLAAIRRIRARMGDYVRGKLRRSKEQILIEVPVTQKAPIMQPEIRPPEVLIITSPQDAIRILEKEGFRLSVNGALDNLTPKQARLFLKEVLKYKGSLLGIEVEPNLRLTNVKGLCEFLRARINGQKGYLFIHKGKNNISFIDFGRWGVEYLGQENGKYKVRTSESIELSFESIPEIEKWLTENRTLKTKVKDAIHDDTGALFPKTKKVKGIIRGNLALKVEPEVKEAEPSKAGSELKLVESNKALEPVEVKAPEYETEKDLWRAIEKLPKGREARIIFGEDMINMGDIVLKDVHQAWQKTNKARANILFDAGALKISGIGMDAALTPDVELLEAIETEIENRKLYYDALKADKAGEEYVTRENLVEGKDPVEFKVSDVISYFKGKEALGKTTKAVAEANPELEPNQAVNRILSVINDPEFNPEESRKEIPLTELSGSREEVLRILKHQEVSVITTNGEIIEVEIEKELLEKLTLSPESKEFKAARKELYKTLRKEAGGKGMRIPATVKQLTREQLIKQIMKKGAHIDEHRVRELQQQAIDEMIAEKNSLFGRKLLRDPEIQAEIEERFLAKLTVKQAELLFEEGKITEEELARFKAEFKPLFNFKGATPKQKRAYIFRRALNSSYSPARGMILGLPVGAMGSVLGSLLRGEGLPSLSEFVTGTAHGSLHWGIFEGKKIALMKALKLAENIACHLVIAYDAGVRPLIHGRAADRGAIVFTGAANLGTFFYTMHKVGKRLKGVKGPGWLRWVPFATAILTSTVAGETAQIAWSNDSLGVRTNLDKILTGLATPLSGALKATMPSYLINEGLKDLGINMNKWGVPGELLEMGIDVGAFYAVTKFIGKKVLGPLAIIGAILEPSNAGQGTKYFERSLAQVAAGEPLAQPVAQHPITVFNEYSIKHVFANTQTFTLEVALALKDLGYLKGAEAKQFSRILEEIGISSLSDLYSLYAKLQEKHISAEEKLHKSHKILQEFKKSGLISETKGEIKVNLPGVNSLTELYSLHEKSQKEKEIAEKKAVGRKLQQALNILQKYKGEGFFDELTSGMKTLEKNLRDVYQKYNGTHIKYQKEIEENKAKIKEHHQNTVKFFLKSQKITSLYRLKNYLRTLKGELSIAKERIKNLIRIDKAISSNPQGSIDLDKGEIIFAGMSGLIKVLGEKEIAVRIQGKEFSLKVDKVDSQEILSELTKVLKKEIRELIKDEKDYREKLEKLVEKDVEFIKDFSTYLEKEGKTKCHGKEFRALYLKFKSKSEIKEYMTSMQEKNEEFLKGYEIVKKFEHPGFDQHAFGYLLNSALAKKPPKQGKPIFKTDLSLNDIDGKDNDLDAGVDE